MKKILAILQAILQLWIPVCLLFWSVARPLPARAENFLDKAAMGQALGLNLIPNAASLADKDSSGNINLHYQGKTANMSPQQLFPDEKNTTDPQAETTFGSNAQVEQKASGATQAMGSSSSQTGKAYQMMTGSINRARVDMTNDPLWQQTDAAINLAMSGVDSNCQMVTETLMTTTQAHVPDYETYERVQYPGGTCNCYHDYKIDFIGSYGVGAWGSSTKVEHPRHL